MNLNARCDAENCVMAITLEDDLLNVYEKDCKPMFPEADSDTQHRLFWRGKLKPGATKLRIGIVAMTNKI